MKNNYPIEKRLRLKRRNPRLPPQTQPHTSSTLIHSSDPEYAAKDLLFELSDNQHPIQEERTLKINQWLDFPEDTVRESPFSSSKQLNLQHTSLHITRNAHAKIRTQTSQERHLHYSVIPHLKSHLRKLESPEKARPSEKRKEANQQKPNRTDENTEFNLIRTAAFTPKYARRPKNSSLYRKTKNSIFIHNFTEGKEWNLPSREQTCCEIRDLGEKVELMKEARRNRTLRKLLF